MLKHFRIYFIPLWFLMSRHQIAGVSSSLVFQRFETFCLLFFINSIWQEFLVWVKTWNSHNQCMMHQNSKYYCQNCTIIYLKSRISSLTAKTMYFYITSTIWTQMNLVLLVLFGKLGRPGSTKKFYNFAKVSYFRGFFSCFHWWNEDKIRASKLHSPY